MKKSSKSLFYSLVGSSIEFSCKKKFDNPLTLEKILDSSRHSISKDIATAIAIGGEIGIILMAELLSYYSKQNYYMMIRGSIELKRYRPAVLDYLEKSVEERAKKLKILLSEKIKQDSKREAIVTAVKYFTSTYVSRVLEFKYLLTKEEFLIIA